MKVKDLPKPLQQFILKYLWFRPAIIYAYSCLNPETGMREWWAYIGKTRQELIARHMQHMGVDTKYKKHAQPWSDLYPEVRIEWQGKCPEFVLDLIEKFYIKRHKPVYNYIHNLQNPRRIAKYQATQARISRDLHRRRDRARVRQ